jgi:hypothetical protein
MTRHGQVLAGRYELGPLLGAGGMASVYRATDPALEAVVMTALAKDPARCFQTASAMGQALARIVGSDPAGVGPRAGSGAATQTLSRPAASGSAPTVVLAARTARRAARGPDWARWQLVAGIGLVVVLLAGVVVAT